MRVRRRRVTNEEILAELRTVEQRNRERKRLLLEPWWACRLAYLRTANRNEEEQREMETLCRRAERLVRQGGRRW